ncbi:hypothetical protein H2248_011389 [Termitomyces sp. 'cryptogamus']|nr:hypothetical protein H2248_011389 [Termitomyces sp. 'cryptogamus']
MATQEITLYTAKVCPYAHRTELALEESGLRYTPFEIDLQNKPEWYAIKVNPAGKVPALAYGGPRVPPDQPSSESTKLSESLIIVEFIADLAGPGKLLPIDLILRAKARFFIDTVANTIGSAFSAVAMRGEPTQKILAAIEKIQSLLPVENYAVGEFTIADIAVAPFFARCEVFLDHGIGLFEEGTGRNVLESLRMDPKFERYRRYWQDLQARESFKKTFDRDNFRASFTKKIAGLRAQQQA